MRRILEELPSEPIPTQNGLVWLEGVDLDLTSENDQVVCLDSDHSRIEVYMRLVKQTSEYELLVDAERGRNQLEKKRADNEKQRADENAQKNAELERELRRLRGEAN